MKVPAQTDEEYASVSSNQCSWAAYEFVRKNVELRHTLYEKKYDEFLEIYKGCLQRASELRKESSAGCLYGENIDTPYLLEKYNGIIQIICKNGIYKNEDASFVSILHPDLSREFYTRKYNENPIENIVQGIYNELSLVVSRHGQSFAVLSYYGKYLICDSHLHHISVVSREELIQHILMDFGGHTHITCFQVLKI